jgi:hypothetical protein
LRRDENGNVAEKNIKLCLNGLSGKAAQSIGGTDDEPPKTACPWYAAATTAGTRRRVLEAALQDPHNVVQFSTDGIVSIKPLKLDIGEELGQWEETKIKEGLYLHSGVYTSLPAEENKDKDGKPLPVNKDVVTTKTRGINATESSLKGFKTMRDLLVHETLDAWRHCKPVPCWESLEGSTVSEKARALAEILRTQTISFMQREFVTAGSAVVGAERFKLIGRWTTKPKILIVNEAGLKRDLIKERPGLYYSTPEREADRCHELVETMPAYPAKPNEAGKFESLPYKPKWREGKGEVILENEFAAEEELETANILEVL